MPVNSPTAEYSKHLPQWQRCRDAYEGSDAVKGRGEAYLPKLDSHKVPSTGQALYDAYKLRALFYNATGRTVDGFAGAIFQKTPTFKVPKLVEGDLADVTLSGISAEEFARSAVKELLKVGRGGILVDYATPPVGPDGKPIGEAQARPYWRHYNAEDVLEAKAESRGGDEVLVRVRLREHVEVPDDKDPYEAECIEQIRVLELNEAGQYTVTLYRKGENDKEPVIYTPPGQTGPVMVPTRRKEALTFIPFVCVGPTSTSPKVEKPPLLDLVDVNLSHYRTSADLEHGCHYTALPTPVIRGAASSDIDVRLGPQSVIHVEANGGAEFMEFKGEGLGTLERRLDAKQKMMATLGARLLEEQASAAETAAAVGMRHAGEHATLRTIAGAIEQALTMALRWHAWWIGTDPTPADVDAQFALNKDFFAIRMSAEELKSLMLTWQGEGMSFETFWFNLTRGGLARPGVTAEEERKAIEEEDVDAGGLEPPDPPDSGAKPGQQMPPQRMPAAQMEE